MQHPGDIELLSWIGGAAEAGVVQHIQGCPHCRERVAVMRGVRAGLQALPMVEPPADGWPRLAARLGGARAPSGRWWPAAAVAAGVFLVAVVLFDGRPVPGHRPGTETTALIHRSQNLEDVLRLVRRPERVMDLRTAAAIAGVEDQIALIDQTLGQAALRGTQPRQVLWRERVRLMDGLVRLRAQPVVLRRTTER